MKDKILNPISMGILGLIIGVVVKLIDIYFYVQNSILGFSLSDLFSDIGIWILFGVLISIYSKNRKYAMINIFLFNLGMLSTYYITAHITNSIYGLNFVKGWTVFAIFSPIMAYFVTLVKNNGILPCIIKTGIIGSYILIDMIFFNGPRVYDIVILLTLSYLLFVKKYITSNYSLSKKSAIINK